LENDQTGERLDIRSGTTGLVYTANGVEYNVYHEGFIDGIDADTLDGFDGSYYTNASNLDSGTVPSARLSGSYAIDITGNANTLDSINSTGFLNSSNTGTGDMSTNGDLVSGRGSGGVALTVNDGYGNANVTWNHQNGTPEQNGNAARIEVNTDSTTNANMNFEIGQNVAGGVTTGLSTVANMNFNGNFVAQGEVTAYSDRRVKDNIKTVENALSKVLASRGVTFTRIEANKDPDRVHLGVIAQEIQETFPEVVNEMEDGTLTVSYGNLAGAFIEAFKEQQTQIEDQAAEIAELRAMVEKLLDK